MKSKQRGDGRWDVALEVEASKLYADGKGKETEAPLDETFDVGVFAVKPGDKGYSKDSVLALERRPLRSGKQTFTLVTDEGAELRRRRSVQQVDRPQLGRQPEGSEQGRIARGAVSHLAQAR